MHDIKEWKEYFLNQGIDDGDKLKKVLRIIETLNHNSLPVILDIRHLGYLTGRTESYLQSVLHSSNHHWRSFKIPKRRGGFRDIDVPYPALLGVQEWIYENILNKIPVSPFCHSYVSGRSIKTNVRWHKGQKELIKLDIKDFFPSITINRIIFFFHSLGYGKDISYCLAKICSYNGCLPQGAPTSPCLSNLIVRPLDYRIKCLAKKMKLHFTRYADDIVLSGESISDSTIRLVKKIIEEEGFKVNEEKTRIYRQNSKRIITGINVRENLSVPREFKRKIRKEIHYIRKYGLIDHIERQEIKKKNYLYSLIGKINFWLYIEPKNRYALIAKEYLLDLNRTGYGIY